MFNTQIRRTIISARLIGQHPPVEWKVGIAGVEYIGQEWISQPYEGATKNQEFWLQIQMEDERPTLAVRADKCILTFGEETDL